MNNTRFQLSKNNNVSSIWNKLHLDSYLFIFLLIVSIGGLYVLYGAVNADPIMFYNRIYQLILGFFCLLIAAQLPPKLYQYISPHVYLIGIILLVLVFLFGHISKGAQRWLNLGFVRFQPSEIIKIVLPLLLAYYISLHELPIKFKRTCIAILITLIPTVFVAVQPDLGTAILIACSGIIVTFLSGMSYYLILFGILAIIIFIPIMWYFLMYDYQKLRILTLLNPESDPLGRGYHIIQSKIAIGSGGIDGKGLLHGTQSQLEFLPEPHTDFIFAVLAEEFGFVGVCLLLLGYSFIIGRLLQLVIRSNDIFSKLFISTNALMFSIYFIINIGMVSGVFPVVGVPLPLISYGGTFFVSLMIGFGIVMSLHSHNQKLFISGDNSI